MPSRIARAVLALALISAGIFGVQASASAAGLSLVVDTPTDASDASPGNGVCDIGTGDCSLRAAIEESNASTPTETDTISFALPSGTAEIAVGQPLPAISSRTAILGATQPGAQALPRITIDGTGGTGLSVASSYVRIDAVAVSGFDAGIEVTAGQNVSLTDDVLAGNVDGVRLTGPAIGSAGTSLNVIMNGNRIGTDTAGATAVANAADGVHVRGLVSFAIGDGQPAHRNVISGNGDDGVDARGSQGTQTIEGNWIGVNASGQTAIPNGGWGIDTDLTSVGRYGNGASSLPISSCTDWCNVISGNLAGGIRTFGGGVSGNVIGLDASADAALADQNVGVSSTGSYVSNNVVSGNEIAGIREDGGEVFQNYVGVDGSGTVAVPNGNGGAGSAGVLVLNGRVGYGSPGTGNVISGNDGPGILVTGSAFRAAIEGNLVGLDAAGTAAIPNAVGISIRSQASEIGVGPFLASSEQNFVAGNTGAGIVVDGSGASHVRNNKIGVGVDGSTIGNGGRGVSITSNGNDVRGNRIVGSGGAAITVVGVTENAISRNVFKQNTGLSVDLGNDGPTPNDPGDADTGANHLLNTIVIDEVDTFGDRTLVHYHEDPSPEGGPANSTVIEFYADPACPASGVGQGSKFLVGAGIRLDGTGLVELPSPLLPGWVISATRTEGREFTDPPEQNTSEFSPCAPQVVHAADVSAPSIGIAWPVDGASYTAGLESTLSFGCDDGVGAGTALCDALIDGYGPVDSGSGWLFGDTPNVTMTVRAVDWLGNEAKKTIHVTSVNGTVSAELVEGGIVSTDPSGIGATPVSPIQTELWSYAGGRVDITTPARSSRPTVPFLYLNKEVRVVAPDSTNSATPQVLMFRVDPSVWDRSADAIRLFHDGTLVPRCRIAADVADPDPCSTRGARLGDGDVQVRVNAMSPSGTWNIGWEVSPFAFAFASPTNGPPVVNSVPFDRPTGTWFTLGGNQGTHIFAHRPTWREVSCWTGATYVRVRGSSDAQLSYDPITDTYEYVASHQLDWKGTCRVLRMRFVDGTMAVARYKFR